MVRRIGMARLERASHAVCAGIEGRLHRVSREETALEQLARLTGLKDHMTARTTALVAEPGAALDARVEHPRPLACDRRVVRWGGAWSEAASPEAPVVRALPGSAASSPIWSRGVVAGAARWRRG
jgi:hypothetical protein